MSAKLALPDVLFLAALVALVATAAWTDIVSRRIPNWLCAATLVLGLVYVGVLQGWHGAGLALAHFAAALAVTMGLFALHAIGAGDAKFYAAIAAWKPINKGLILLVAVSVAGFVLLLVFLATRVRDRARRATGGPNNFDKLPYGVAIGVGGLLAVALA